MPGGEQDAIGRDVVALSPRVDPGLSWAQSSCGRFSSACAKAVCACAGAACALLAGRCGRRRRRILLRRLLLQVRVRAAHLSWTACFHLVCWGDCTCEKCTLSQMLGLRVRAGYIELSPSKCRAAAAAPRREDQSGLQPLADTFVLDSRASCWQARAPRSHCDNHACVVVCL